MSKRRFKTDDTLVDVVIPVFGNYEFIKKNLEFLRQAFKTTKYKVYLTDDESPEYAESGKDFWAQLKIDFPEIANVVIHSKNTGYAKSVNDSAIIGKSKYVLVLNSDLLLLDSAGDFMANHLESNEHVGIVFPKLLFFPNQNDQRRPSGKIQHCGIVFDINHVPRHIHLGWDADHPFVNVIKDFNACTGACFMIRREIWLKLKGYDPIYGRGTYEDIDLCFRVRMMDKRVRYLPMSVGYHFANLSFEKYGVGFPVNQNRSIWLQKFNDNIPFDEWIFAAT